MDGLWMPYGVECLAFRAKIDGRLDRWLVPQGQTERQFNDGFCPIKSRQSHTGSLFPATQTMRGGISFGRPTESSQLRRDVPRVICNWV